MILQATHTHLYPGHRGKIAGLARIADLQTARDCQVAFSDGSVAFARISRLDNGWRLYTSAYRSAAGTDISEKLWVACLQEVDDHVEFRILEKAQEK
jgi:hypothetical protein